MPTYALRAFASLVAALAGGTASLADVGGSPPEPQNVKSQFLNTYPQARVYENPEGIATVYGQTFSNGKSPEASAGAFVGRYAGMFNVESQELLPISQVGDGRSVWPIM